MTSAGTIDSKALPQKQILWLAFDIFASHGSELAFEPVKNANLQERKSK